MAITAHAQLKMEWLKCPKMTTNCGN